MPSSNDTVMLQHFESEIVDPSRELFPQPAELTFTCFPELPDELQLIIWRFTFPKSHKVFLGDISKKKESRSNVRRYRYKNFPVGLHVCHISQEETLKYYNIYAWPFLTRKDGSRFSFFHVSFSPLRDTLRTSFQFLYWMNSTNFQRFREDFPGILSPKFVEITVSIGFYYTPWHSFTGQVMVGELERLLRESDLKKNLLQLCDSQEILLDAGKRFCSHPNCDHRYMLIQQEWIKVLTGCFLKGQGADTNVPKILPERECSCNICTKHEKDCSCDECSEAAWKNGSGSRS